MHRDLKPSNVLITAKGELKLCDFGLSRTFNGPGNYSTRVITLWYRPPELLLGARHYDQRVDVWSTGCIFGELLAGHPLFPESSEGKVFQKICERCGAMSEDTWPEELRRLPQWEKFAPRKPVKNDGNVVTSTTNVFDELLAKLGNDGFVAVDLLQATLKLDPGQRIGAESVLAHRFFAQEPLPCQPNEIRINQHLSCHELDVKRHHEARREAQRLQNKRPVVAQIGGAAQDVHSPKRPKPL